MRNRKALGVFLLTLALAAAGCSDDDAATTTTTTEPEGTTTTEAATTTAAPTTTTIEAETTTTEAAEDPLVVWIDEARAQVIEGVGADFEADTGIPVAVEEVETDEIRERMLAEAPAGEGPDVFVGPHEWVGELAAEGLLAEIDLPYPDDYFPVAIAAFTLDRNLFGLPSALEAMALLRNTDLVPEAPATLTELVGSCEVLGDTIDNCLGVPAGDAYANQAFIHAFGGYLFGYTEAGFDRNDVGLDGEGALAAADFIDARVKAGLLDPTVGWAESADLFAQGVQPYMWSERWQIPLVEEAGVSCEATTFPPIEGNLPVPFVKSEGFMINALSEQPVVAQAFVTEFLNSAVVMLDLYDATSRGPAHQQAYEFAVADDPDLAAFTPVDADPAKLLPNIRGFRDLWEVVGQAISVIYNQDYTQVEGARAAFQQAAEALRGTPDGG